jgi:hypothetical protein
MGCFGLDKFYTENFSLQQSVNFNKAYQSEKKSLTYNPYYKIFKKL